MNTPQSNSPLGIQRDLRIWSLTIAAVGFAVAAGVLAYPATGRIRSLMLGWLAVFVAIGIYQRRKMTWPPRPREGAATDEIQAYRLALQRRCNQQHQWPARRWPVIAGTVALSVLLGLVRLFASNSTKLVDAFWGPMVIAVVAFAMYAFTRKQTNRAATAFQNELDRLSPPRSSRQDLEQP